MKIITGGRQTGKTTELLKAAHNTKIIIVCPTLSHATYLKRQAINGGYVIKPPISFGEFIKLYSAPLPEYEKRNIDGFMIDDVDQFFNMFTGGKPVTAMTSLNPLKSVMQLARPPAESREIKNPLNIKEGDDTLNVGLGQIFESDKLNANRHEYCIPPVIVDEEGRYFRQGVDGLVEVVNVNHLISNISALAIFSYMAKPYESPDKKLEWYVDRAIYDTIVGKINLLTSGTNSSHAESALEHVNNGFVDPIENTPSYVPMSTMPNLTDKE